MRTYIYTRLRDNYGVHIPRFFHSTLSLIRLIGRKDILRHSALIDGHRWLPLVL